MSMITVSRWFREWYPEYRIVAGVDRGERGRLCIACMTVLQNSAHGQPDAHPNTLMEWAAVLGETFPEHPCLDKRGAPCVCNGSHLRP